LEKLGKELVLEELKEEKKRKRRRRKLKAQRQKDRFGSISSLKMSQKEDADLKRRAHRLDKRTIHLDSFQHPLISSHIYNDSASLNSLLTQVNPDEHLLNEGYQPKFELKIDEFNNNSASLSSVHPTFNSTKSLVQSIGIYAQSNKKIQKVGEDRTRDPPMFHSEILEGLYQRDRSELQAAIKYIDSFFSYFIAISKDFEYILGCKNGGRSRLLI